MLLLSVYLGVALVFSFLCSIAEAVLLRVNRGFIESLQESNASAARRLRSFRDSPEEPLSAILTLNTVAHTVGAAGVGHQAAVLFGEQWLGLCSALLTLLILVGSEIIPKTLGATHWRRLAPAMALAVEVLTIALYPVLVFLRGITNRLSHSTAAARSRNEIESTVLLASESEHLSAAESAMLRNVLTLRQVLLREIMTPRVVVFAVPQETTVGEYLELHADSPFSRIPLFGDSIDDITGYILRSAILEAQELGHRLSSMRRDLPIFFETSSAGDTFARLTTENQHIAVVANEFGGTAGIVTLEDIIETLVGHEIIDELDPAADLRQEAREKYRERVRSKKQK